MKIRTIKYIIKEGGVNAYRNKLMSLASIGIMTATLVISGLFFLVSANLSLSANALKTQAQIQVFCTDDLDDFMVGKVEEGLKKVPGVTGVKKYSKKENFERLKGLFPDSKDLLEGLDEKFLTESFDIKVSDPSKSDQIVELIKKVEGVRKVQLHQDVITFYTKLSNWIRAITVIILLILLAFSVFIISNTVKLTVFARRREVNIMKYIGATDWFIRWPFIIEGVIIGIIGSVFAFAIVIYGYHVFINWAGGDTTGLNLFRIVQIDEIWKDLLTVFAVIGCLVGSGSSVFSLRKHLQV